MPQDVANSSNLHIRSRINEGGISLRQILIVGVCCLLNVADGFDVVAISMAAPHIADSWGISATTLGVVLSAELVGMMVGSIGLSALSDRYGRRKILIGSVSAIAIAIAMLLTTLASSVTHLIVLRVITGLGIGGVLASAAAVASEFTADKYKHTAVIIVTSGFACGALAVGPIAAYLLEHFTWQSLFLTGGLLGVILAVLVVTLIPESMEFLASHSSDKRKRLEKINRTLNLLKRFPLNELSDPPTRQSTSVGFFSLLSAEFLLISMRFWLIFFLGNWVIYLMLKWTPKLFVNMGYELSTGIYALTLFTIGGLFGNIFVGFLSSTRLKLIHVIAALTLTGCLLILIYATWKPTGITELYSLLFLISFCATGPLTGMYAVTLSSYPTQLRASGLGWSLGIGRTGAIASPVAAGYLVDAGWNMFDLFLILGVPAALISSLLIVSANRIEHTRQ
ncbi:MFS transporter [Halioxenophilus aromaticivorans]|uniref:MFS transporter n=1 Tax=Halioxenophilus aromaticivorans TaxID=1306992 RepID=UPI0031ED3A02